MIRDFALNHFRNETERQNGQLGLDKSAATPRRGGRGLLRAAFVGSVLGLAEIVASATALAAGFDDGRAARADWENWARSQMPALGDTDATAQFKLGVTMYLVYGGPRGIPPAACPSNNPSYCEGWAASKARQDQLSRRGTADAEFARGFQSGGSAPTYYATNAAAPTASPPYRAPAQAASASSAADYPNCRQMSVTCASEASGSMSVCGTGNPTPPQYMASHGGRQICGCYFWSYHSPEGVRMVRGATETEAHASCQTIEASAAPARSRDAASAAVTSGGTTGDGYAGLLDRIVAEDSRSWMAFRYREGSIHNVTVSNNGGTTVAHGDYDYLGAGPQHAWVEVRLQNGRASCVRYWDFPNECRAVGQGLGQRIQNEAARQDAEWDALPPAEQQGRLEAQRRRNAAEQERAAQESGGGGSVLMENVILSPSGSMFDFTR